MPRAGRRYYLQDVPLHEAVSKFHAALDRVGGRERTAAEAVHLEAAASRVTAGPITALLSSPHYDSAAMDGAAVRSADTVGATETSPVRLEIGRQAAWVDTGDPIPDEFDAVIMIEVIHQVDERTIEVQAAVPPYQHVRALGEDIAATELLLPGGHRLRPQDLAACAAAGLSHVDVRRRPKAVVLPTGNELVAVGSTPGPSEIIESNGLMLAAMVEEWGAAADRRPPVPDDRGRIKSALADALETADVVLVNAGSSAGSEDYTAAVVEEMGELLVHGIAVRPGHPVVLGVVRDTPVIGIPGYSVSAAITCEIIVRPLVEHMLGLPPSERQSIAATISRKVSSPMGEDDYLRVRARARAREDGRDTVAARRGRDHVDGPGRRTRAHTAVLRGTRRRHRSPRRPSAAGSRAGAHDSRVREPRHRPGPARQRAAPRGPRHDAGVVQRRQPGRSVGPETRRGARRRQSPAGRAHRGVQRRLRPAVRRGRRRAGQPDLPRSGAHRRAGQSRSRSRAWTTRFAATSATSTGREAPARACCSTTCCARRGWIRAGYAATIGRSTATWPWRQPSPPDARTRAWASSQLQRPSGSTSCRCGKSGTIW